VPTFVSGDASLGAPSRRSVGGASLKEPRSSERRGRRPAEAKPTTKIATERTREFNTTWEPFNMPRLPGGYRPVNVELARNEG